MVCTVNVRRQFSAFMILHLCHFVILDPYGICFVPFRYISNLSHFVMVVISLITTVSLADFLVLDTIFCGCFIVDSINVGHQCCGKFLRTKINTCERSTIKEKYGVTYVVI